MVEILSYRGFHWTHPAMVHWRKDHLVDLSVSGLLKVFGVYCGLAGALFLLVPLLLSIVIPGWHEFPKTMSFAIGDFLLGSCFACYLALKWGPDRDAFDKLLEEVVAEWKAHYEHLYKSNRNEYPGWGDDIRFALSESGRWGTSQQIARHWLVVLAQLVLESEQKYAKDALSESAESARQRFRSAYQTFERFGLVSGGYQQFFDQAAKFLAEKKSKDSLKEPPANGC